MGVNVKSTGRAVSMPAGFGIGALFAAVWTVIGSMVVAKLMETESIQENAMGYGAVMILLSASFLSALVAFQKIKHRRALVCLGMAGIYFLMLLATTALIFGGQYTNVGVTALVVGAGGGAAALLGVRKGRGRITPKYKKR